MPAGDPYALESDAVSPLSEPQRSELARVVEAARSVCGFGFGVYVGPLPDGRDSALAHHAALPGAASAVLVAVDPSARAIEIVTGINTRSSLDNRACEFAALTMKSCFVADDLVGGVREGVTLLAAHARHPQVMHLDDPA